MLIAVLGASGVGKSSIIRELCAYHPVAYLQSYTTRQVRGDGNDRRISVDLDVYTKMVSLGQIAIDTEIHGNRYGVLKSDLSEAISGGKLTVVDWSIYDVPRLEAFAMGRLSCVYLFPERLDHIQVRLRARDGHNLDPARVVSAESEVQAFFDGMLNHKYLTMPIAIRHGDFSHGYQQLLRLLDLNPTDGEIRAESHD